MKVKFPCIRRDNSALLGLLIILMTLEIPLEYYSVNGHALGLFVYRLMAMVYPVLYFSIVIRSCQYLKMYEAIVHLYFILNLIYSYIWFFVYGDTVVGVLQISIYFMIPLGIYMQYIDIKKIAKVFKILSVIGIIIFIYIIISQNFDIALAVRRIYTWTNIFYFAGVYWAVIPVVLLFSVINKYKVYGFLYWGCAILINLFFLKRYIIVDSLILLAILAMYYIRCKKVNGNMAIWMLAVCFFGFLLFFIMRDTIFVSLYDAVINKLLKMNPLKNERILESVNYIKSSNIINLFWGSGFFGTHSGRGFIAPALHIGWMNYILKGGFSLLLLILVPTFKAFRMSKNIKCYNVKTQFSICMLMANSFRMFYVNTHSMVPELLLVFYCCGVVMMNRGEKYIYYNHMKNNFK